MKSTEELLHQLDGIQGSLEIVHKRVGLEGVETLRKAINDLEAYVDQTISDLEFEGTAHDPSAGIDSEWLLEVVKEARGE